MLGTAAINLLVIQKVWEQDIFQSYPHVLDYVFCFSAGYELYDLGTMVLQDMYVRNYNEGVFWIHHTSMLIGYSVAMWKRTMGYGAALLMVTELTVLPSNAHWYLKAFCNHNTRAFHFNQGLRLWCFVFLRLFTAPVVLLSIALNWEQFWNEEPLLSQVASVVITLLLGYMNVSWTKSMIHLYQKRTTLREKLARQAAEGSAKSQKGEVRQKDD